MKRRIGLILLALLQISLFTTAVSGQMSIPESTDYYVNDYMGVLSDSTADWIGNQNLTLDQGAEILVLTTDYIGTDTENFAYEVFNQWKIGDLELDNGILIVLVVKEEKYWITWGAGIEQHISYDQFSDIVYTYLEPAFDQGNYDKAVKDTFDELYRILAKTYGTISDPSPQKNNLDIISMIGFVIAIIFVVLLIAVVLGVSTGLRRNFGSHRYPRPRLWRGYRRFPSGSFSSRSRSSSSWGSFGSSSSSRSFRSGSGSSSTRSSGGGRSRGGGIGRR